MRIASRAFRSARARTARCWCTAMPAATRSDVIATLAVARPVVGERPAPVRALAPRTAATSLTNRRRHQAQRGRACHLAGTQRRRPARRSSPISLARTASPATADAPLSSRAEASLGRHLAGDGGAGDARRRRRRSQSTAPSLPATAQAKRRSIRRR